MCHSGREKFPSTFGKGIVMAQKVHIVSVPAAQEVRTFPLPGPAAFSPDGKYLVMGNNDAPKYSVVLWPQ